MTVHEILQDIRDSEVATALAFGRHCGSATIRDSLLSIEELKAEELVKIRAKRIEEETRKSTEAAYASARERGINAAHQSGATVARAALITRNKTKWSSIEQDLNEASRNGLSQRGQR